MGIAGVNGLVRPLIPDAHHVMPGDFASTLIFVGVLDVGGIGMRDLCDLTYAIRRCRTAGIKCGVGINISNRSDVPRVSVITKLCGASLKIGVTKEHSLLVRTIGSNVIARVAPLRIV